MPVPVTGAFGVVVESALQVAQAVRDAFATRTNKSDAQRLAVTTGAGSTGTTTPQGVPWDAETALEWFDMANVDSRATAFQGVVFNGRDLFFVPYGAPLAPAHVTPYVSDFLIAYNTSLPFGSTSSYQTIALTTIPVSGMSQAQGFLGGVMDPKGYLYLVPNAGYFGNTGGIQSSGVVVRFDTSKLLSDTTAYSTFDVTQLTSFGSHPTSGYATACCDGRWIYLCPVASASFTPTQSQTAHGWAVRYDTTKTFSDTGSWDAYNLPVCLGDSDLVGYQTIITDGKYVYYAPFMNTKMVRYTIGGQFQDASSWTTFDWINIMPPLGLNVGPTGATQVGRYAYFVPFKKLGAVSVLARYDTQAPGGLSSTSSWATFDLTTISNAVSNTAKGYQGAITDGVYLYLIPNDNGLTGSPTIEVPPFLRYDTRGDLRDINAWAVLSGTHTPTASQIVSTGGASDGVYGYNGPYGKIHLPPLGSGQLYRWRLWPGSPDAPSHVGMARSFWLDSTGRTGFGTQTPQDQIHVGSSIQADGTTVPANVRADIFLLSQMGASGHPAPAEAAAAVSTTLSANSGTSLSTLVTYTLPKSSLRVVNDGVRISAFGYFAGNNHPKNLYLNFGASQVLASGSVTFTGGSWYLRATVLRQAHAVEVAGGIVVATSVGAAPVLQSNYTTPAEGEFSNIPITVQAQAPGPNGASGDINLAGFVVEFIGANA